MTANHATEGAVGSAPFPDSRWLIAGMALLLAPLAQAARLDATAAAGVGLGNSLGFPESPSPDGANPRVVSNVTAAPGSSTVAAVAQYESGPRTNSTGTFQSVSSSSSASANLGAGTFSLLAYSEPEPWSVSRFGGRAVGYAATSYDDGLVLSGSPSPGAVPPRASMVVKVDGRLSLLSSDFASQAGFVASYSGSEFGSGSLRIGCAGNFTGTCQLTRIGALPSSGPVAFAYDVPTGVFSLSYEVAFVGAMNNAPIPFRLAFETWAYRATSDFSHTAALSITAAPGVTWSSQSGLLLSAVPEPQGYRMLAAGLLAFGLLGNRKRRRAEAKGLRPKRRDS